MIRLLAAALACAAPVAAVSAQDAPAAAQGSAAVTPLPALEMRLGQVVPLLKGEGDFDDFFAPSFKAEVSKEQFEQLTIGLTSTYGAPLEIVDAAFDGPDRATFTLRFERADASAFLVIDPAEPHRVTGMLLRDVTPRS